MYPPIYYLRWNSQNHDFEPGIYFKFSDPDQAIEKQEELKKFEPRIHKAKNERGDRRYKVVIGKHRNIYNFCSEQKWYDPRPEQQWKINRIKDFLENRFVDTGQGMFKK